MNLQETYNRIARDWHKDHQKDDWWVEGVRQFISLLPAGGSVLDVGCGAGTKTKYLQKKGLDVMGIDFAAEMIAIAKEEVPNAEFAVGDMRALPLFKKRFDGIFAQASLLHISKNEAEDDCSTGNGGCSLYSCKGQARGRSRRRNSKGE